MSQCYFGINVQLDGDQPWPEQIPRVCTDMKQVQMALKLDKTARFKQFDSEIDAEAFSHRQLELRLPASSDSPSAVVAGAASSTATAAAASVEKQSPFRAPSRPECQQLRACVESGDVGEVRRLVSANPRLLINSVDTPTLLREGPRQNALHLAALSGQHVVCSALLELVGDPATFQRLYPDDSASVVASLAQRAVDLFLNMPTRGSYETPLHLAAKAGHSSVVSVLVSFAACKRDAVNKHGDTAAALCCSQFRGDDAQRGLAHQRIIDLLQQQYYVPVLADQDGASPPLVASPCRRLPQSPLLSPSCVLDSVTGDSPRTCDLTDQTDGQPTTHHNHHHHHPHQQQQQQHSPLVSPLRVRAWAGPMSRHVADELYRRWRHPCVTAGSSCCSPSRGTLSPGVDTLDSAHLSPRQVRHLRASDPDKGLERIGRVLAAEMHVQWAEFWSFLDCSVDITSQPGLEAFEKFLCRQSANLLRAGADLSAAAATSTVVLDAATSPPPCYPASPAPRMPHRIVSPVSPVTALCGQMKIMSLHSPPVLPPPPPPPSSSSPRRSPVSRRAASDTSRQSALFAAPRRLFNSETKSEDICPPLKLTPTSSSSSTMLFNNREDSHVPDYVNGIDQVHDDDQEEEDSDGDFFTPPSSPTTVVNDDVVWRHGHHVDACVTPPLAPQPFIGGAAVSRADLHVYRALAALCSAEQPEQDGRSPVVSKLAAVRPAPVDASKFPCVAGWWCAVSAVLSGECVPASRATSTDHHRSNCHISSQSSCDDSQWETAQWRHLDGSPVLCRPAGSGGGGSSSLARAVTSLALM